MKKVHLTLSAEDAAAIPAWSPPPGYTMRGIEVGDEPQIAALWLLCAPVFGVTLPALSEKLDGCLDKAGARESARVILDSNQLIVGFAVGGYSNPDEPMSPGTLSGISTHPEHRRHGLGFGVLAAVIEHLTGRGCSSFGLSTMPNNTAALVLYEKLGFRRK